MLRAFREGSEHVSASSTSSEACFSPSELDLIDRLLCVVGVEAERKSRSINGYMEKRLEEGHLPQVKLLRDALHSTSKRVDNDFAIDKTSWHEAFARLKSRADEGVLGYRTDKGSVIRCNFENFLQTCYHRLHPPWQRQIMQAASKGHVSVVKDLLANGNVDAKDAYGSTVLINAAANGHLELVQYLVKNTKVDVEARDDEHGRTALLRAAEGGHLEVVRFLFEEADANVETRDNLGRTALFASAERGDVEVVQYLVEKANANVEAADNTGVTVMARASLEVARYLVEEAKADIGAKMEQSKGGLTVLEYAQRLRAKDAATEYLQLKDAEKLASSAEEKENIRVQIAQVRLGEAAQRGDLAIVEETANEPEIDVDAACHENGLTALMLAARNGHVEVVRYLCAHADANVSAKTVSGNTALIYGAESGSLEVVAYLVEHAHADVDAPDKDGGTALMKAASEGKVELVRYLVEDAKADVDAKDWLGATALDKARLFGRRNKAVVDYLMAAVRL